MYKCLKKDSILDKVGYQLVPIRQEDMEAIRVWRNAQIDILRQNVPISKEEQQEYFSKHILPIFEHEFPKQILFSFLYKGTCIGYGGLTGISWESRRAEVSFLLDPKRVKDIHQYHTDFLCFLNLLSQVAFKELHFHRLFTETFSFRDDHIKVLEEFGFKFEGTLKEHIYKKGDWYHSLMHGLLARETTYVEK
ncbi:MAG: GNAT family N-acetyltransferase [Parachlamydiaceae bacterium]|nr:GNAT family N-acetyltransferase [Parachlamydiaceae bacterium]